jgi:hypothetical protein
MRATIPAAATRGRNGFGRPRRSGFWLGVVLMALSFAVYPAYPLVAFFPMSWSGRAGVAAALVAISWSMFLVGSLFAGKKGLARLKQRLCAWRA